jgi:uncharacterized protein (PEP-CTERM system associated)
VLFRFGLAAAGAGSWVLAPSLAHAQALPYQGTDVRVGDLRQQFAQAVGETPADTNVRAWTLLPSIGVSEAFDDGVPLGNGRSATDFITQITPSLAITADTQRLTGTLTYAPTVNIYAIHGDQNYIAHNLRAQATATFVPDLLYVDLQGFAAEQSLGNQGSGVSNGQNNSLQSTDFSIKPYLLHRFGDIGVGKLDYTLDRSAYTSGMAGFNTTTLSNTEHGSFITGEILGRYNESVDASATQFTGTSGALNGAHRESLTNQLSYALSRDLTLIGSIGYEDIVYPQASKPFVINDITWSGGFSYTPSPRTSVQLSYGRQQGGNSASLKSTYAPTARTLITATYSQVVGTDLEGLQNGGLNQVSVNNPTFNTAQGPVTLLGTYTFNVPQAIPVYRTTNALLSGILLEDLDTYTVTVTRTERQVLSGGQVQIGTTGQVGNAASSSGYSGSLGWARTIDDGLGTNASVTYGYNTQPYTTIAGTSAGNAQTYLTFNVGVTYALSETLSTSAQYTRSMTHGNDFGYAPTRDIFIVSLTKNFF